VSKLLVVDIGNTTTKVGVWEDGRVTGVRAERTSELPDVSAVDTFVAPLADQDDDAESPLDVALCSVVPQAEARWLRWVEVEGAAPFAITGEGETPLRNRYRRPEQLGPDRLAAAVGAASRLGTPVIVVSLGTATVVDVVSPDGRFLGGMIAAGVSTGLCALADQTAALPRVDPRGEVRLTGSDTEECMRSGAVIGTAAMIEGLVARMQGAVGEGAPVAVTGGYAELIGPHLRIEHEVLPHLVLEGTALIWEHNREGD